MQPANEETSLPSPRQEADAINGVVPMQESNAAKVESPHTAEQNLHQEGSTQSNEAPSSSTSNPRQLQPARKSHPGQVQRSASTSSAGNHRTTQQEQHQNGTQQRPSLTSRWNSLTFSLGGGQQPTDNHNRPSDNRQEQMMRNLEWFGKKIFDTVEAIGEGVVSVLGLDDSRYQDVLDGMTEEEMEIAERINREREQEYMIHKAKLENERTHAVDVESAGTTNNGTVPSRIDSTTADPAAVVLSL